MPQAPNIVQRDNFLAEGTISIGPYSVLIISQDRLDAQNLRF